MGPRQRAQKRGKASKGSQKGTPTSQKKLNSSIHVHDLTPAARSNALMGWQTFALTSSPSDRRGFTMGDAARNTERHASGWGPTKYRDQGISFVSAGNLHQDPEHTNVPVKTPQDSDDTEEEEEEDGGAEGAERQDVVEEGNVELQSSRPRSETIPAPQIASSKQEDVPDVPVPTLEIRNPPARSRTGSSSSSSSSASDTEQIVFTGRSKGLTPNMNSSAASKRTSRTHSPAVPSSKKAEPVPTSTKTETSVTKPIPIAVVDRSRSNLITTEASSSDRRVSSSRLLRRGRDRRRQYEIDEQEALMRDYIANMAMDDTEESDEQPQQQHRNRSRKNETIRFYDGSGEENAKVQIQTAKKTFVQKDLDQAMDWNSDDLQDFDDISTTDDEIDEISQVLRHRERESGVQYLVTPHGCSASDSKWVSQAKLVSESARREIAIFGEILAMEFEDGDSDEDDDDDEDETTDEEVEEALNDLVDHIESEDDENARILKHTARMSDEQIARALAKQEELGMGGDEVMLFSGEVEEEEEVDMDDVFGRGDNFISFSMKTHTSNRTRSKRNKKNRDSFPSAAAFADALDEDPYGGFDVMDFDRPSLRPKKKGRKSDFPYDLELEDEELRDQLVSTWTKDRDKKAQRKRDKEEARQAALLEFGDRGEPAAIKAEIRRFLMQEVDTLRLVPMESSTRASVHRLAKALKLNSRSEGKDGVGIGRYPVLSKTIRTPSYTIDTIWQIDALLNTKKFFPKNAGSYKNEKTTRAVAARTARMRRSGGVQGASYMNGEIVGASAPEIGAENKGRALLEKMGWTSGMAIGAEGNKGSLEAVKHVFKTSRAGLG